MHNKLNGKDPDDRPVDHLTWVNATMYRQRDTKVRMETVNDDSEPSNPSDARKFAKAASISGGGTMNFDLFDNKYVPID